MQYGAWLWHAVHGDLGSSLLSERARCSNSILRRFPNTLLIVGLRADLVAARRRSARHPGGDAAGSRLDAFVTGVASLGVALPNFWLAMLLVATFSLELHWLSRDRRAPLVGRLGPALMHATLPAIALAAGVIAELARQVRSALIEVLRSQYVRTLRAKGLSPAAILWKHGLQNVSVTLLTVIGLQVNRLFSARVVIEAVFAIPGIGSLVAIPAINKDFPVVQGVVLVLVIIVIRVNLLVDVLNALLDPRVGRNMTAVAIVHAVRCGRDLRAGWPTARRAQLPVCCCSCLSIFAPVLAPYSPTDQDVNNTAAAARASALARHRRSWPRRALSRLIWGAPTTLYASFLAVTSPSCSACRSACWSGFLGGWVDEVDQPVHRRAAVVPADRAGDRRHRRARHRPDQRHARRSASCLRRCSRGWCARRRWW